MAVSTDFTASSLVLNGTVSLNGPTALVWGPDGRLYVTEVDGDVKALTVAFGDPNPGDDDPSSRFHVTDAEVLGQIKSIPNFDDDGTPATGGKSSIRQVTGIDVTPQFDPATGAPVTIGGKPAVVVYVSSSDSRIGAGGGGEDANLDTNSGVITRLTQTADGWLAVDIVRGLARSEENHATNGMEVIQTLDADGHLVSERMIVASGGNANTGAPSNNFAGQEEQPTSAAILEVDLSEIRAIEAADGPKTDPVSGRSYVYDLPTLDDPTRGGEADASDPFGGNDSFNSAKLVFEGPVQIYSAGYRNAYDVEVTEDGRVWTYDNGANNNWGGRPAGEDSDGDANSTEAAELSPPPAGYVATNLPVNDNTEIAGNYDPQNWDQLHEVTRSDDLAGRVLSAGLGGAQTYQWDHPDFDQPLTLVYGGHPNPTRAEGARAGLLYTPEDGIDDARLLVSNVAKGDGTTSDFLEVISWLRSIGYSDAELERRVMAVEPGVTYADPGDDAEQIVVGTNADDEPILGPNPDYWADPSPLPTTPGVFTLTPDPDGPVGLPADIDEIVHALNPIEGDFREAGFTDGSVDTGKGSINGMAEYTSSIFDDAGRGDMQGALVAASLNQGQYYIIGRDENGVVQTTTDGGRTIAADRGFFQSGGAPLGLASLGDDVSAQGSEAFRGTLWGAIYKQNGPVIEVLQPGTADDPLLGPGLYAGQEPFDPTDNDRDGVDHLNDPFEFDADNGLALAAGQRLELNFSQVDLSQRPEFSGSIGDTGLLGAALDGRTPNRDAITGTYADGTNGDGAPASEQRDGLFDNAGNIIPGGNAPTLQLKTVRDGTAVGAANTLRDGLHTGVRLGDDVERLVAEVDVANWWSVSQGGGRVTGLSLGDGTQSNFVRLVWGDVGPGAAPGLRVLIEVGDAEVYAQSFADANFAAAVEGGASTVTLKLEVSDIGTGGAYGLAARYSIDGAAGVDLPLGDLSLPEGVLRAVLDGTHAISDGDTTLPSGAAVGIVAEKDAGVAFPGIDIAEIRVEAFGNEIAAATAAEVGAPGTPGVDTVLYAGTETALPALADDVENFDGRGSSADYAVTGNALDNEVAVGTGANTITTGAGADIVRGTRAQLAGDTITDFAAGDAVLIEGAALGNLSVVEGAGATVLGLGGAGVLTFDAPPAPLALEAVTEGVRVTLVPDETVVYRVNAGSNAGPDGVQGMIAALDGGPAWIGDADLTAASGVTLTNDNGNTYSDGQVNEESEITFAPGVDPAVVPWQVFANERGDNNGASGGELTYTFDVTAGATYRIDYFYTENWNGYDNNQPDRVFDVKVEGAVPSAFDDIFPAADAAAAQAALGNASPSKADILGTAMVRSHELVAGDDALGVTLTKLPGSQNPKVNAIQVVRIGGDGGMADPLDVTAPVVASITVENPLTDQDSPRTATVVATDERGFDLQALEDALDGSELTFAGVVPGSVSAPEVTLSNGGTTATLTYTLTAPGDAWPQGRGTVSFAADVLTDAAGNASAAAQAAFVSGTVPRVSAVAEGGAVFALGFGTPGAPLAEGGFTGLLGGTGALEAGQDPRIEGGDLALTTSGGDLAEEGATASKNDFVRAADVSADGIAEVTLSSRMANPFDAAPPNYLQQGIVVATDGADNQAPDQFVKLVIGGNALPEGGQGTVIQMWSQGTVDVSVSLAAMSGAAVAAGRPAFAVGDVATVELALVIDKVAGTVAGVVTLYDAAGLTLGGVRPADAPGFATAPPQALPADVLAAIEDGTSVFGVTSSDFNEGVQVDDGFEARWEDLRLTSPQVDVDRVNGVFQGDFSGDHLAPTDIGTLAQGATTIVASQAGDAAPGGRERDYITFTVAEGQELTGIVIRGYQGGEKDSASAGFIAIAAGAQVPLGQAEFQANFPDATDLLGGYVYDAGDVQGVAGSDGDILDELGDGEEQGYSFAGFDAPLAAGTYTIWLNQGAPEASIVTLDLVSAPAADGTVVVSISGTPTVVEAEGAVLDFTLTASDATFSGDVAITYDAGDETGLTQTVTFAGGAGTLSVPVVDDDVFTGGATVAVTLTGAVDPAGGSVPLMVSAARGSAEGTVTDDEPQNPDLPKGDFVFGVNAGGDAVTDGDGNLFAAPVAAEWGGAQPYAPGGADEKDHTGDGVVDDDDEVYDSEFYGDPLTFTRSGIAAGDYVLTIKLAEIFGGITNKADADGENNGGVGARVIDFLVNGTLAADDVDVFAAAGVNGAFDLDVPVTIADEGDGTGTLTITGDPSIENAKINAIALFEAAPDEPGTAEVSVADVTVDEEAAVAVVTFTRTGADDEAVTITYETADGTATAGEDYVAVADGTVVIPAGGTGTVTVGIALNGDMVDEPDETFTVAITGATAATNAVTVADGEATVTLIDDDAPNAAPTIALTGLVAELSEGFDTSGGTTPVATIVVADDGLGENALSLSGADAGLFTIVEAEGGPQLHLAQDAALDHETNPTLDVTVAVDDPTVGETPDDTAAFSLAVTDVPGDAGEETAPTITLTQVLATIEDTADVTVSIKVADITVTGIPAPQLSLAPGPDAGLFEFVQGASGGQELHLTAGAVLEDATNPSLDVIVRATNTVTTATAEISVAVADGNDAPTTSTIDAGVVGEDDAPIVIDLLANAADPDGDALSVSRVVVIDDANEVVTAFVAGSEVSIDPSQFAAALGAGETLALSVFYEISDGRGGVTPGLATLVIEGADDAITWHLDRDEDGFGVADPATDVVAPEQPADPVDGGQYAALAGDADDDDATVYPGAPEINDGLDNDQDGETDEDNTPPIVADPAGRQTPAGEVLTIAVADLLAGATDADGDALGVASVSATNGTAVLDADAGVVRFTPAAGHQGEALITFTVSDGFGGTAEADLAVTVTGDDAGGDDGTPLALAPGGVASWGTGFSSVQDAPRGTTGAVVSGDSVTLGANHWKSVALDAPITVREGAELRFDYTATGVFELIVVGFDSDAAAKDATGATYQIGGTDAANFATSRAFDTYDVANTTASFAIPLDALVGQTVDRLVLVQDQDAGPADFVGTFSNLRLVEPDGNLAPVADDDALRTFVGEAIEVPASALLANDADPEGAALTLVSVAGAQNGAVTLTGGVVTFTPAAGFEGEASFTYTVRDAGGATDTATATVTVEVAGNEGETPIDFSAAPIRSYTGGQDVTPGGFAVGDGGDSLTLTGNTWKRIALPGGDYVVTDDTVLRVQVTTLSGPGEIVAIGVEADNDFRTGNEAIFQLAGAQGWSRVTDLRGQGDGGFFEIDLGALAGASVSDLVLIADHDVANPTLSVRFEDVALVEGGAAGGTQAPRPALAGGLPDLVVAEDGVLEFDLAVIDPDTPRGDLTVAYAGLPGFVQVDGFDLSGTPLNEDVGTYQVGVAVTDPEGNVFNGTFGLAVTNTNDPVEVRGALAAATAVRGGAVDLPLTPGVFVDPDVGDAITYSATGLPDGLTIDPDTGAITGVATEAGQFTVVISATDGASPAVSAELVLEVRATPPREAVLIEAEDFTGLDAAQNFAVDFDGEASGDALILVRPGQFGSISTDLGAGGVTPGRYELTVAVFDENDGASTLDVEVVAADGARTLVGQVVMDRDLPGQGNAGQAENRVEVSLGAVSVPAGATLVISGLSDAGELLRVDAVRLTPLAEDGPSVLTTALVAPENGAAAGVVQASGEGVTHAISGGADAALFTIDADTGALAFAQAPDFEAPADQDGDNAYEVEVTATANGASDAGTVIVTVADVNEAPALGVSDASVVEGETAVATATATDPEGAALTFGLDAAVGDNALFSVDQQGAIRFLEAPAFVDGGDNAYDVTVSVSDGVNATEESITVTVTDGGGDGDAVVYRINAGGAPVAAIDGGPAWTGDAVGNENPYLVTSDSRADTQGYSGSAGAIPDGVPEAVLDTARSSNAPFTYDIPTSVLGGGQNFEVRLYVAELFPGGQGGGFRDFDATLEGFTPAAFDDIDPGTAFGADVGVLTAKVNVDDGALTIGLTQDVQQNPIVNAIEVVALDEEVTNPGEIDVGGALDAFASQPDLDTSAGYGAGVVGSAVLEVMTGIDDIQSSNFGNNSFQVTNTGGKKISAIYIDVNEALYPDSVFDPDGQGGDDAAKPWQVNSAGGTGAYVTGSGYFDPGPDPIANTTGNGGPSNGGFKGAMVKFTDFDNGEIAGFSGDMDPNSIAGLTKGAVDGGAILGWDVGGISGHEIIGSSFTVLFDDGTTASGELASDGSSAGSHALATQAGLPAAPGLEVDGIDPGGSGTYGGASRPSVVVTGDPGDEVQITLTKGFNPVTNTSNGIAALVEDRLDRYEFEANNAFDAQTVTVTIGAEGTFDASGLFDYDDAPANNVGNGSFAGDDVQPIRFVATKVQAGGDALPISATTAPITLVNQGGPVTGDPTDGGGSGGGGGGEPEGYFAVNGSGSGAYFKVQVEDGTGGTDPGGKWNFLDAPDGQGRQANFQGEGYYLFGSSTSTGIDNQVGGNELLEYTIFVPEDETGVYDFRVRASRDGEQASDQQNDIWWNFKEADEPGLGDVEAFLTEASDEAEPVQNGFVKLFGGPNNGSWGYAGTIDGVTPSGNNNGNFGARIEIEEAGLYTVQLDGRSQGFHVDWWELNKAGGSTPGTGAADSAFVLGEPDMGDDTGGGGGGPGDGQAGAGEVVVAVEDSAGDWSGGSQYSRGLAIGDDPVSLRFTGIDVPDGAVITEAFLRFQARGTSSEDADLTIRVEDDETAAPITAAPPSGRTYADAFAWDDVETWIGGVSYESPDLADLIAGVIGADGVEDGALAFVLEGTGGRRANAFDDPNANAPELVIRYEVDDGML